jgi:hypothetical protein
VLENFQRNGNGLNEYVIFGKNIIISLMVENTYPDAVVYHTFHNLSLWIIFSWSHVHNVLLKLGSDWVFSNLAKSFSKLRDVKLCPRKYMNNCCFFTSASPRCYESWVGCIYQPKEDIRLQQMIFI